MIQDILETLFPSVSFQIVPLPCCMTNIVFRCTSVEKNMDIIVRIFKKKQCFNFTLLEKLYEEGLSPKPIHCDSKCFIEEYIQWEMLPYPLFNDYLPSIANTLAKLHTIPIPKENQQSQIWKKIYDFFTQVETKYGKDFIKLHYKDSISLASLKNIEKHYSMFTEYYGLCHNDLHHANILTFDTKIKIIDFDYLDWNPIAYDIANHWLEYMYDYTSHTAEIPQKHNFPNIHEQLHFLRHYAETSTLLIDIEKLHKQVIYYLPIVNLYWSLWGFLQTSKETSFEYDIYAIYKAKHFYDWYYLLFKSPNAWKPLELPYECFLSQLQVFLSQIFL